jgi:hypothetical protein
MQDDRRKLAQKFAHPECPGSWELSGIWVLATTRIDTMSREAPRVPADA